MRKLEDKEILKRYAYYYDYLKELGQLDIDVEPTIKKIKLTRGVIQQAYKEMKEPGNMFMGNIIDYLEWISANFYMWTVRKAVQVSEIVPADITTNTIHPFPEDLHNLYRLYFKNKDYVVSLMYDVTDDIKENLLSKLDRLKEILK
jgi:DNA-binding Lrp family transcriptional regulator